MGIDPAVLRTSWWTSCFVGCMQALKEGFLADGRFRQEWDISERPDKVLSQFQRWAGQDSND